MRFPVIMLLLSLTNVPKHRLGSVAQDKTIKFEISLLVFFVLFSSFPDFQIFSLSSDTWTCRVGLKIELYDTDCGLVEEYL